MHSQSATYYFCGKRNVAKTLYQFGADNTHQKPALSRKTYPHPLFLAVTDFMATGNHAVLAQL
jgi:hypothetical protein